MLRDSRVIYNEVMNSKDSHIPPTKHLITGGDDPFLPVLIDEINNATNIDIAVAFIKDSGFRLIKPSLEDAIRSGVTVRILTSDYLQVTDPIVLREIMTLTEIVPETAQNVDAKAYIFHTDLDNSFHLKAYMFVQSSDGIAYIGSSNISRTALQFGLEWNLRVRKSENPIRFTEILHQFERLLAHSNVTPLTHEWIDEYQQEYKQKPVIKTNQTVPDEFDIPDIPDPYPVQIEALDALAKTRLQGNIRGLVVLATGMGKTWLAAFDAREVRAKRILFVAHREEILQQAEQTFARIRPDLKIGKYNGSIRDKNVEMLFASIQTIGKIPHLSQFTPHHFDYIVIDEFHHAAARTYRKLLNHFETRFLLGLTATPNRSDQADILSLCDNNLVFSRNLFNGIEMEVLCPFKYWGIADTEVDYKAIPWRNGKFDPEQLVNQLATYNRAQHVYSNWLEKKQIRTLAFCTSIRHADFMANFFSDKGVRSVSVHNRSSVRRNQALQDLEEGRIDVIFSVDLFNEGVDLPTIDTVLMLRPTESQIIFLQQLGRGLRTAERKNHLVIIDFIGNHISFFKKAEALFNISSTGIARKKFIDQIENQNLELPPGCFVNYTPEAIDFMRSFISTTAEGVEIDYSNLFDSLGRRPTLNEFFLQGGSLSRTRSQFGQWHHLPASKGHLTQIEKVTLEKHGPLFLELEKTSMTKCFKMILLEAFVELKGFTHPIPMATLAERSFSIIRRYPLSYQDLPESYRNSMANYPAIRKSWELYWVKNPIKAWSGGNTKNKESFFQFDTEIFAYKDEIDSNLMECFEDMVMEIVEYKFNQYFSRHNTIEPAAHTSSPKTLIEIPYFNDLKIACGFFLRSEHKSENIQQQYIEKRLMGKNPDEFFIARAQGDSMNKGKQPIQSKDYLLLRYVNNDINQIDSGTIIAIEQRTGDSDSYLLKTLKKHPNGSIELHSTNPNYQPILFNSSMNIFAEFVQVLTPLDLAIHKRFMREEIPPLFGLEYNIGSWNSGHVCPKEIDDQIILATLNKQGKLDEHKYHDYFIDESTFHWQTQNSIAPSNKRGNEIINHVKNKSLVHLFVRQHKLHEGKAAPFLYLGAVRYKSHTGEKPMSVVWKMETSVEGTEFIKLIRQ